MQIGKDFEKINFEFFGLDLMEPNALIGDLLIACLSAYFYFRFRDAAKTSRYSLMWTYFFLTFALTYLLGGLGHAFFGYTGIAGKIPALMLSTLPVFFIEQAMIGILNDDQGRKRFMRWSRNKLYLATGAYVVAFSFFDFSTDVSKTLIISMINSIVGLLFCLGFLAYTFSRQIDTSFNYLWWSVIILVPSVFVQSFKVNFHPLFDRNDFGHLLIVFSLIFYAQHLRRFMLKEKMSLAAA